MSASARSCLSRLLRARAASSSHGSIGTFFRTLIHLKPQQIVGRLRFKLHTPAPDLRSPPRERARVGEWIRPARRQPSLLGETRLRLLNVEYDLRRHGWDDHSTDRLLRYNVHYFDDLNAYGASERVVAQRALVSRWIAENSVGNGTGWEPYPLSLRIVNWIKWILSGVAPEPSWTASLAVQARWLTKRLEVHLLGNHLFANAKALVFAGLYFQGKEPDRWLDCGMRIIERELGEQILHDGGHFERSPMYHSLILEDVLDILNVLQAYAADRWPLVQRLRLTACQMLRWLRLMVHPDGEIGFFNDAAIGIAPTLSELERYAEELGVRSDSSAGEGMLHLADSGYIRAQRDRVVALIDVAPIGCDYLPGHAHADTLSFELSLDGSRLIVNGGASSYGDSAQRRHERSTAAHSTVEIAGVSSSEMWRSFRVGRRARPFDLRIQDWEVRCSHDGYRFLPGAPTHERCWLLADDFLQVNDIVLPHLQPATARYILAPGLHLEMASDGEWFVSRQSREVARVTIIAGRASRESATYAPQFGIVQPTECLAVRCVDARACTRWTWM